MKDFKSNYFTYRNNKLYCEDVSIERIAVEIGTPVYIYSKNFFIDSYNEFTNAFKEVDHNIFFAAKANFNLNVIKIFSRLGSGIDVNSAGEFYRALKAGVKPERMILTGVGKTSEEIKLGIESKVLMIKAESEGELHEIDKIAGELGKKASVAIRINPDVDPRTHPYISTGLAENKFGIDSNRAFALFKKASRLKNITLSGIDMHIGSQITDVDPFVEAVSKMAELYNKLKSSGINLSHFDIGGGMGIVYNSEKTFTPANFAKALLPQLQKLGCTILFEPGRSLTANGGILVTKVLYTKQNQNKNFVIVDAGMNDLLRPSIYTAYHHIQPVKKRKVAEIRADIVGPVCESGDFFAKDRIISSCKPNDLLAIMSSGAYGMVMASNYNARRRPAEIIVDGGRHFMTRSRESFVHLISGEKIIKELHR